MPETVGLHPDDHFSRDIGQFASLPRLNLFSHRLEVPLIRSTPTEMQSVSENDFECFATCLRQPTQGSP